MDKENWNDISDEAFSEAGLAALLEAKGYRVTRYVYPQGTVFPPHTHELDKIDAVVSGEFELTLEGRALVLKPGEWIAVPRGCIHSARVIGTEPVVSLDAVRTSG